MSFEYLRGTDEGYSLYKKYLSMSLYFRSGVPCIGNKRIRESKCGRDKYSANNSLYIFEKIVKHFKDNWRDPEMLLYSELASKNNNVRSYNVNDKKFLEYRDFVNNFSYIIERDIKNLLQKNDLKDLFNGEPTNLLKLVYTGELRPEAYLYMSYVIDLPKHDDFVSKSVHDSLNKAEEFFFYFTGEDKNWHENNANIMIQTIIKTL